MRENYKYSDTDPIIKNTRQILNCDYNCSKCLRDKGWPLPCIGQYRLESHKYMD